MLFEGPERSSMDLPIPAEREYISISHTLLSSGHSVHINVASGNYVITCTGDSYFGLADNPAG
jgi:hypothetical protein